MRKCVNARALTVCCLHLHLPQAYMDSTYMTVDNYLISCGLTHTEIEAIRRNLLQPAAAAAAPAGSS